VRHGILSLTRGLEGGGSRQNLKASERGRQNSQEKFWVDREEKNLGEGRT